MSSISAVPDLGGPDLSGDEQAALLAPYEPLHDHDGVDLAPFPRFWIDNDPGGFKRLKQHLPTLWASVNGEDLPLVVGQVMYAYGYMVVGNAKGALYEVIGARRMGVSRDQVGELVRHAALAGGPLGINPIADLLSDYLDTWSQSDEPDPAAWPQRWTFEPTVFRSGIDHSRSELTAPEWHLLQDWYERMLGGVPAHFADLATWHPSAFKTMRIREEHASAGTLPDQLIPLLHLHVGLFRRDAIAVRRALALAKALGLHRHEVVCAIYWACVPGGEAALHFAYESAGDLVSELP